MVNDGDRAAVMSQHKKRMGDEREETATVRTRPLRPECSQNTRMHRQWKLTVDNSNWHTDSPDVSNATSRLGTQKQGQWPVML